MSQNNIFTDRYLKNLKPDSRQTTSRDIREKSRNGFAITLFPSGLISFIHLYHFNGRKRRMTIGRYPHMNLADAKKAHRENLKALENNIDPAEKARNERLDTLNAASINALIIEYIEIWAKPRKRSWKEDQRILNKDVKPLWGKRKAADISKRDVILLLEEITKRGAPIAANRTLACIRRMFNFAIERDLLSSNPCATIKAPSKETPRERHLTAEEINIFWNKLDQGAMSPLTKLVLKLQLTSAQRKGEIISAEWSDISINECIWTIPSNKAKNGKTHRVSLSGLALELIKEVKILGNGSRWLFPAGKGVKNDTHMTGEAVDHALRRSKAVFSEIEPFSPHSLRATAATHMASMGISSDTISRILNHSKQRDITSRHYNKYDYDDEKRNALEAWSNRLQEIIEGVETTGNIIPLKNVI